MLYRVRTNVELFDEWKKWEQETGKRLLSSLVQNDMFLTTESLNEDFEFFHQQFLELSEKYTKSYLTDLISLRDRTAKYIKDLNKIPLSQEEFDLFSTHCPHVKSKQEGFANIFNDHSQPQYKHCTHEGNRYNGEHNCNMRDCPLLRVI